MLVLAAALLAAMALAGHAGATPAPGGFVHAASDAMHLIAAGTWVGGLLPLALMLGFGRPAGDEIGIDVAATAARRFSTIGMLSVGTLAASGALDTWFLIGNLSDLAATDYGRLLSLKITLFIAMLVWGMVFIVSSTGAACTVGGLLLSLSVLVRPSAILL